MLIPVRPRRGRPRIGTESDSEDRIIAAATCLFLQQGFERTKLDQVALDAQVSKTTLYGRFTSKESLFERIIQRSVQGFNRDLSKLYSGSTLQERLYAVGTEVARATLTAEAISVMRITLAEAERFPSLAQGGFSVGFGACVDCIAQALAGDPVVADVPIAQTIGKRFVEMALHPLYFHAFFGADLQMLRGRIPSDVAQVARLLAIEFC
jgi:AcrR family transcriptional regulator